MFVLLMPLYVGRCTNERFSILKTVLPLRYVLADVFDPFLFCCLPLRDKYPKSNGDMGPAESLVGRALGQGNFGPVWIGGPYVTT